MPHVGMYVHAMCVPIAVHQCGVSTCDLCVNSRVCEVCSCVLATRLMLMHSGLGLPPAGAQTPARPLPSAVTLGKLLHFSIKWGELITPILTDFCQGIKVLSTVPGS